MAVQRFTRSNFTTSSTRERYDVAVKLGEGRWLSRGSYPTLDEARSSANGWLEAAGSSGRYTITNEIGSVVEQRP